MQIDTPKNDKVQLSPENASIHDQNQNPEHIHTFNIIMNKQTAKCKHPMIQTVGVMQTNHIPIMGRTDGLG